MFWRNLHLIVGTLGLFLFMAQGQYMARVLGVPDLPDVERVLYRSVHIYLLGACVANVCVGYYLDPARAAGILERLCSVLLLVSPALLGLSFFTESSGESIDRPLASMGLYILFAAAALLATIAMVARFRRS